MKLLSVLKQYNKCILRENAKLKRIYNTLIKESEAADETCETDDDVVECGDTDVEEAEEMLPADEFFSKAGVSETEDEDGVEEAEEMLPAEEFFDKAGVSEDEEDVEEAEKMLPAKEFFSKAGVSETEEVDGNQDVDEDEDEDGVDEAEEMMSAEEFFGKAGVSEDE